MILRAEFMHRRNHRSCMLGWHIGMNAMSQIKHMAVAFAEACKHPRHFFANGVRRCVERIGIEIAL